MRHTEATKDKIKATLDKTLRDKGVATRQEKICPNCGLVFFGRKKKIFCSTSCSMKNRWTSQSYRDKISEVMKNSEHKGWKSRKVKSYPEKFWEDILNKNGFIEERDYFREKRFTKKSLGSSDRGWYFLDFFFPEIKLDLEIDGKQHNRSDHKISDQNRDILLEANGIRVLRLPWKGLRSGSKETWDQVNLVLSILQGTPQQLKSWGNLG